MAGTPLTKISYRTAAEVCANFNLEDPPRSLLREGMTPGDFLAALLSAKQSRAGIDFLAHALPARDAIWWGCLCLQHAMGNNLSDVDKTACKAAVRWVLRPAEDSRALASAPAEAAGPASPAGALATAAFYTGANIAPPKAPPIAPGPFDPAKAVARAVKLASIKPDPARILDIQKLYLELGIGVAQGRFLIIDVKSVTGVR